jgi:hypothetical protein
MRPWVVARTWPNLDPVAGSVDVPMRKSWSTGNSTPLTSQWLHMGTGAGCDGALRCDGQRRRRRRRSRSGFRWCGQKTAMEAVSFMEVLRARVPRPTPSL